MSKDDMDKLEEQEMKKIRPIKKNLVWSVNQTNYGERKETKNN